MARLGRAQSFKPIFKIGAKPPPYIPPPVSGQRMFFVLAKSRHESYGNVILNRGLITSTTTFTYSGASLLMGM